MFKRSQYQLLYNRLKEPRRFIQVVAGPRQVGKSTMVKQLIHDIPMQSLMVSADLIPPNDSGWIRQVWEQARQQMRLFSYDSFLLQYKKSYNSIFVEINNCDNLKRIC